jgi:hypothetical protein
VTRSPDPCRLVNFLGFAGLAVCCRNVQSTVKKLI